MDKQDKQDKQDKKDKQDKLHWFVGLQYPLLNTTELGQGGSARYGGVDVNIPSGLVELMFGRWAELGNNPATT